LAEVKKIVEAPETMVEGKFRINEFTRTGFNLRDSNSLGLPGNFYYLYIKADEDFFKRNEKSIMIKGVTKLSGKEYEEVKKKIEDELSGAESGLGSVFEGF